MDKRTTFLAAGVAMLFFAAPATAQMTTEIAAKAGVSFSKLDVEDADFDNLTAFVGGGHIRFDLGSFSVQPEVLFVRKGAKESDEDGEFKIKIDYVEIPVLLRYDVMTAGGVAPFFYAGPAVAFEIACNLSQENGQSVEADCDEVDEFPERKSLDVGILGGAGVAFAAGPGNLFVEGRYNFGLTNISDSELDDEAKNRSASVMVGYAVSLSR